MPPHGTAFLHDGFLLYVQIAHYGQRHLARNQVSISNTISTAPGSMLPRVARGSGGIDVAFVGGDSFVCCALWCKMQMPQDKDIWRRRCCCIRKKEKGMGEDHYDIVLIQVGKQGQDAGSCRELCSISLIPGVRKSKGLPWKKK